MNYLTYPCKVMNLSQSYTGTFSHSIHSTVVPSDYPIDEPCSDSGRDYMYCPCDEMKVMKVYGVMGSGTNTIWLTSTSKVKTPKYEDFVTMMVIHPEDDDLSEIIAGKKYKRGEQMFREGKDGFATGNHFHISVGLGVMEDAGWTENSHGAWVITTRGGAIKPEDAFYVDKEFTQVLNSQDLTFQNLPGQEDEVEPEPPTSNTKGIDVSKHNGYIDWKKVKADGIDFAMIRAGWGYNEGQIDERFEENAQGCIDNGIDFGFYWFSYAMSESDAIKEADQFNKVISKYKGKATYPMCYDFEYESVNWAKEEHNVNITKEMATSFVKAFCKRMEDHGWYSMNYLNYDYYVNWFDKIELLNIDRWYANWTVNTPDIDCGIWQYTNKGVVDGVASSAGGNLDMNVSYKDYPSIIKEYGLNGFGDDEDPDQPEPPEDPEDPKDPVEDERYKELEARVEELEAAIKVIRKNLKTIVNNI